MVRKFIRVALLAASLGSGAPVAAEELKLATLAPEGSAWLRELRAAGATVRERTAGRVTLKWYGSGIQGTDARVLRKVRIGQLHGGTFTMSGLAGVYPDAAIYGLPLLFRSADEVAAVRARLDPKIIAGMQGAGFTVLGIAGGGFAVFLGNEPVATPADLQGRKIWLPEGDRASLVAMRALGLAPVVLPVADVMTGLQTGLLDVVAAPPAAALVLQWHTRVRFATDLPLAYSVTYLAVDNAAFARLAPADQTVLTAVLGAAVRRFDARTIATEPDARRALQQAGIRPVAPDAGSMPGWELAVRRSYDDMVSEGVISAAMLAEVNALLADVRTVADGKATATARR